MPSARLLWGLGLAAFVLPAALLLPPVAPAVLVVDVLLLAAFLIDLRRARGTPLAGARRWPPLLVQGTPEELVIEISRPARDPARKARPAELRIREALHPGLAGRPARTRARLLPGGSLRWRVALAPRRRGRHESGPTTVRVLGPWGLAWSQRELLGPELQRVFPQIRWRGRVGQLLALARRRRLGWTPRRLQGAGSELYALRDYQAGDPLSRVHWKATARFGKLVAREDTWERGSRLVVLLDCARAMASAGDRQGGRSKLDHALATSLALARVAVGRGDAVTLLAFSDRIERSVKMRAGGRDVAAAYAALYDLEARRVEPAYDLAAEAATAVESRGATVILLTSVVDPAAAELLRSSLLRLELRHRPLLVNLEDPELHELAAASPATPAAAFAQIACLEILLANRRLAAGLRRAGVRFVSTSADRLALETLSAYLQQLGGRRSTAPREAGGARTPPVAPRARASE